MEFEAYTIMRSENMKKIWIVAMTMCILLTGCGSKKQVSRLENRQDPCNNELSSADRMGRFNYRKQKICYLYKKRSKNYSI